jgi:hypothetical protein
MGWHVLVSQSLMALKLPLAIILSSNLRQQMHVVCPLSVALSLPVCMSHTMKQGHQSKVSGDRTAGNFRQYP